MIKHEKKSKIKLESNIDHSLDSTDDESNNSPGSASDNDESNENSGWASCMAKVLNTEKPKHKKSAILSKTKKLSQKKIKIESNYDFKIEGEIKEEKPGSTELEEAKKNFETKIERRVSLENCIMQIIQSKYIYIILG